MSTSKAQRVAMDFNGRLYRAKGIFKTAEMLAKHIGMTERAENIKIIAREVVSEIEHKRNRQLLEFKPIIVVTGISYDDNVIIGTAPGNNGKRTKKTIKLKNVLRCWHWGSEYLELETKTRCYLLDLTTAQRRNILGLLRRLGTPTPWKFDI